MAVYVITGELGSGKTLLAVSQIQKALFQGRRVATNIDLHVEHLVGPRGERDITRLPDWPTRESLDALGEGYQGPYDEAKFGVLVLDEVGTFINAREWQDAGGRMRLIHWLLHARKARWHVYLLVQSLELLDKQVRVALAEHVVTCRRLDRMSVPLLSHVTGAFGFGRVRMPQIHIGVVRYGTGRNAPVVERWTVFSGRDLHQCYDTSQRILGLNDGAATVLDHRHARYLWRPRGLREALWALFLWRWVPPSVWRRAHDTWRLRGAFTAPYKPAAPTYAEWLSARAAQAGALGVGQLELAHGEAPEPSAGYPLQDPAEVFAHAAE